MQGLIADAWLRDQFGQADEKRAKLYTANANSAAL